MRCLVFSLIKFPMSNFHKGNDCLFLNIKSNNVSFVEDMFFGSLASDFPLTDFIFSRKIAENSSQITFLM